MRIPNVILFPDVPHSACSHWRAVGVYNELSRLGLINLTLGNWDNTITTLRAFDIAIFQRPMSKEAANQVFYAKDVGLKVIIDHDDYAHIPKYHPVYKAYTEIYDESIFMRMMLMADHVTTTNDYLKDYYSQYNQNISVVPNALNDYWLKIRKFKTSKRVLLRCGDHHDADMYEFKDEITNSLNEHPDFGVISLGSSPIFIKNEIKNFTYGGNHAIHEYFAFGMRSPVSVIAVPLINNEFNRGKSNISWIEATLFGGCALTPFFMEDTVSYKYNDKESFYKELNAILDSEFERKSLYEQSVELINEKYLLSKVNEKRMEIINNLMS